MAVPGGYGVAQGPHVTIRQIKKDSVDFVLSNVDLALNPIGCFGLTTDLRTHFAE